MSDHPIENLMKTAMESIKEMVDVNTVVGDPVETPDGTVIIPISRVSCGFAAGGGEYETLAPENKTEINKLPFGGGSGAGVSVQPMGFLVVGKNQVRLLPVDGNMVIDRLIDVAPQVLNQVQSLLGKNKNNGGTAAGTTAGPNTMAGGSI
ncbi:MAG: GerW family sporulation protein [Desulfitobacteriaceae bacterium]|nr:GerW family sporulation protein [Desulfitobacteriaceae bacterium]MDD4753497.1 GerW family sporulation protein [Desulfitobacteriaceae bacterium]